MNKEHYNEIIPGLFLGDMKAAKDEKFFKKHNIKAVLNCTVDVPNFFRSKNDIEYMRIPVEDSLNEKDLKKMYRYYHAALEFIHKNLDIEKKNVFIHCWQGIQRSASVVAIYLMWSRKMDSDDAYDFIIENRPVAFHNGESFNFDWSIQKFYKNFLK